MSARIEALEKLRRKIENAYHERCAVGPKDYPPFALSAFEDRPRYHQFILKLIDEEIDAEKR